LSVACPVELFNQIIKSERGEAFAELVADSDQGVNVRLCLLIFVAGVLGEGEAEEGGEFSHIHFEAVAEVFEVVLHMGVIRRGEEKSYKK